MDDEITLSRSFHRSLEEMEGLCVIIALLQASVVVTESIGVRFICHGDVCNNGKEPQFCSEIYRFCRNCVDIKDECGSPDQPRNCTAYCQDLAVESALQKKLKAKEDSCLVLPMMMNLLHGNVLVPADNGSRIPAGSELKYACNNGYKLEGVDTSTCLGNDMWSLTTFPHCSDHSWTDEKTRYEWAVIGLSILNFLFAIITVFGVISHYRSCKKANDEKMSRTNTDSSFNNEDAEEPLILTENQSRHDVDETVRFSIGPTTKCAHNHVNDASTKTPAVPTAPPPADGKDDTEQPETSERNRQRDYEPRGVQQPIIINNLIMSNTNNANITSQPKDDNRSDDISDANNPHAFVPRSIDMKLSTEVTSDNNEHQRGTNGTDDHDVTEEGSSDMKRNGTEPLQARVIDKQIDKGPKVVAAKGDLQSPTKETEREEKAANIGLDGRTFDKSDLKRKEGQGQHIESEDDESLEPATKESGQDDLSAKVGFKQITFPKSDIEMKELKECN